jgi:Tfp pilus assembly protein FimT
MPQFGDVIAVLAVVMARIGARSQSGFTLNDMVVAIAVVGILSAIGLPTMVGAIDRMRLGQSAREVERELQLARSRAVAKGRPIRVRFNCPTAGEYRIVELIGSPASPATADTASNRCSETAYPYPASDDDPSTRPNLDGPIRHLDKAVTFSSVQTLEFWPDGTTHHDSVSSDVNPWPLIPVTGITISLAHQGKTSAISINGLGKIQLQ